MNKQLLAKLCNLDGVSGRETAVRDYILRYLEQHAAPHETVVDAMGNVLVHLFGRENAASRLMLDAHMDEVGFLITHMDEDGLLSFETVGGIDKQVLFGHRVRIGDVYGVIGGKPVHHCKEEERAKIPAVEDMRIDIGAADLAEAAARVRIGDAGTFITSFCEWENGFFCGKAVDDRVGCALLLSLSETVPERDIWLSFSVQEEVGLRGAKAAAEAIRPDIAIAVEGTTAADVAGSTDANCVCRVGSGAVVPFADRATLYDHDLYEKIRSIAAERGIAVQTKTKIAGGNNAGAIQRSGEGVRMAAVSLPCRYIHSPVCTGNWSDIETMERLLRVLIGELTV